MPTQQEFLLVEKRFEALNERFKWCCMSKGSFTKEEILKHIKAKDNIGRIITEHQLYYLKRLKER